MASAPVSNMSDAAVLAFKLSRWDYQLLTTHDIPMEAFNKAKTAHLHLNKANKADTRAVREAEFLAEKRPLIAKLLELRAAAGQAMRKDPRVASAAITVAKEAADTGAASPMSQRTSST